jgi:hypothetical protein
MNIVANFEYRASSSRGKHEGESSFALCDRLSRTRDNSQRQLPTDHDYAVPTREYQTDQSSLKTARLLLALSSRKRKDNYKNIPTDFAVLTWSLHIRAKHSVTVIGLKWRFCVDGKSSVMECKSGWAVPPRGRVRA